MSSLDKKNSIKRILIINLILHPVKLKAMKQISQHHSDFKTVTFPTLAMPLRRASTSELIIHVGT